MFSSLSHYSKALSLIFTHKGLKRYAAIPVLINLVLYFLVISTILQQLWSWEPQIPQVNPQLTWIAWINPFLDDIASVAKWVFGLPMIFLISYFTFVLSCLVIASPFNDILSERTERIIQGSQYHAENSGNLLSVFLRSIFFTAQILVRQLFWTILVLPLLLIPYIGFLPLLLITAYFTGVALVDIPMCRKDWSSPQKKSWIRKFKYQIIGLGLIAELSFLVPVLPLFFFPLGVIAGTILYCQDPELANNSTRLG